ncbi:helix-turn-helix domain-containing protein [Enterococcus timonensis]|uniref:helix-turn-helix domain-containing protein n=1 Tax=Enterococcus timonensis TaxID=1852364 RepID=UPI0008D93120|nr:helix-turn-helix domain-containing protein [Enterococcus timonensis]
MSFNHLSLEERKIIERALHENWSLYKIAKKLGRHRSTIGRELKRAGIEVENEDGKRVLRYRAKLAEQEAQKRKLSSHI